MIKLSILLLSCIAITIVLAEPPAYISWDASQFMNTAKVTRYLNNGSSIERKYITLKAKKACNGWSSSSQLCAFRLDEVDDLNYSYRIREYDRDGKQVSDLFCTPLNTRWQCLATIK